MQAEPVKALARRGRGGRPPAKDAGDVDRRILDAAAHQFAKLGFDATSCEQIVLEAGAGKASLYARYANKEALFAAVVRDHVERTQAPAEVPVDLPLRARLHAVGRAILDRALQPDAVALMRVVLTTAHRMADLARLADQMGRDDAVRRVGASITAGSPTRANDTIAALRLANKFVDLAYVPIQMRALLGDDPRDLADGVARHVDEAIELLAKGGWLDGWA
ncbi:TetR/AcrR family transcriptional regulator [Sphingomonas sp. PB2P19]|uniref:TetR/AcrR family transcriptional regulator n=1 Tax=Sphingomonas rhamnosi TaxID=3096156 RepID=UPI002FC7436A